MASGPELLQVADAVAREKLIDREDVLAAMEQAIARAGRAKYGMERNIQAEIDRKKGYVRIFRRRCVVDELGEGIDEILLEQAKELRPDIAVGEEVVDELPLIEMGRVAAQAAKQVIVQRVREAERVRQYEEYKNRAGEVVSGLFKREEQGNVTIDLGRAEGYLPRQEKLPRELFRHGNSVRAYIYDVRREQHGPQIFLSRVHPQFLVKLFNQEVPEIYNGVVEIKAVARDPGSRAKIAVISNDSSIDPVGACVGMRGSRVQAVVGELGGEKIDIVPWFPDPATVAVNALAPSEVTKIILDEEKHRIEAAVPESQLSLAIGRRGQNVRLASQLCGWEIDITTEEREAKTRQESMNLSSTLFIEALEVDDVIARLLVIEGFTSVEQVAFVPEQELTSIEGFDAELVNELRTRANEYLSRIEKDADEARCALGVEDALKEIAGLTTPMLVQLGQHEIRTRDELADLASDELREILGGDVLKKSEADAVIMAARAHWFANEDGDAPAEDTQAGDAPAEDTQAGDAPAGDTQAGDAQAKDAQAEDAQAGDAQAEDAQAEDAPAEDAQAEDAPAGDASAEGAQAGDAQAGDAPANTPIATPATQSSEMPPS